MDIEKSIIAEQAKTADNTTVSYENYYDLKKYKGELESYVGKKYIELNVTSKQQDLYLNLRKAIFAGATTADKRRFPYAAEVFKVYKSALISANLSGYSALFEMLPRTSEDVLKVPKLKQVMTDQLRSLSFIEKISGKYLEDWLLKGECCAFLKLNKNIEKYRMKETLSDKDTGEDIIRFSIHEYVNYTNLELERIDPFNFFVDAYDYEKDPLGTPKIIRSYISAKELLSSKNYPELSEEDKKNICTGSKKNGGFLTWRSQMSNNNRDKQRTNSENIEVLTFYGDYITNDYKILKNIKVTTVGGKLAEVKYNGVSTNRIIFCPYYIDDETHRGVSPLASSQTIDTLTNRVIDLFLKNMEDVCNPLAIVRAGALNFQQYTQARKNGFLEYVSMDNIPQFWTPPLASQYGLNLLSSVVDENNKMLGLNTYLAGDTSGAVRTARESSILFQNANARMRVETDVFSYGFLLPFFTAFYTFNRELALCMGEPLDDIYLDPTLSVIISTNATRADKEAEANRLMQLLTSPVGQMIFANLTPEQTILAVRYLMAKFDLVDADNLLELFNGQGQPTVPIVTNQQRNNNGNNQTNTAQ